MEILIKLKGANLLKNLKFSKRQSNFKDHFCSFLKKSFLPNISQIIFIVIITPENARHGWVIKEGKNGSDDETAEPSKFIKKFSSMAIAIVIIIVLDLDQRIFLAATLCYR